MKKSNVRDYIITALRFYARFGEPDEAEIKKLTHLSQAERLDLSAVAATLEELSERGDVTAISAVREIYFVEPTRKMNRNEISERLIRYALNNYISERTAWRMIERAFKIFVDKRILRVE